MKCVMILDENLLPGQAANTAAVLGISLSAKIEGLTGPDITDSSGRVHSGITNIPVPVLISGEEHLKRLYDSLLETRDPDIIVIGFNNVAQESGNYSDFEKKLYNADSENLKILGLCLYGDRKRVNKMSGNLKLLN